MTPVDQSSFIKMFGELHFNQASDQSSSSSSFPMSSSLLDFNNDSMKNNDSFDLTSCEKTMQRCTYTGCHRKSSDNFSSMNSESLQLCTEGLGFESFDDVEDLKNETSEERQEKVSVTKHSPAENLCSEFRRSRTSGGEFPPPISCIGKSGKPWVCFKSYRHDGRFVLKEIRMPTQEVLHACREDGRLKLQFVQPNDHIQELEEKESEEEENGSIHDDGEEEMEADTTKYIYEAENELQV